ncbi:hypothetical protein BC936DRAFT_149482 [Jimgerdemannia flammicorona]|uniref:Uncharacterized protein n=1 Tax=Jimgerdemannia flammicorona TaxID=994334 RepID=A0A433D0P9_9FUNG|nr:hypothetical protein BC936DRAFT_149482 [Jimgerdemannia flammicorona]
MTFDPTYTSLVQDFKPTTQLTAQHMTMADLTHKVPIYLLITVAVPILVPLWFIIASSVLTVQGLSSRRRVGEILKSQSQNEPRSSHASVASSRRYSLNAAADEMILVPALDAVNTVSQEGPVHVSQLGRGEEVERQAIKPVVLDLKPAQKVVHTFLNQLEWEKKAVCIEGQLNSHGAIIIRTKRFDNEGGRAAVKHFVDNFEV